MDDISRGLRRLERVLDGSKSPGRIQLSVLRYITENFSDERKIGQGGCAIVYKGILPKSGRAVAVKKLLSLRTVDDQMFTHEVTAMIRVKHQNIVTAVGYCSEIKQEAMQLARKHVLADEREMLLCFEYVSKGSLEDHVTDELRGLEWHTRFQIIKGICQGLHHLHSKEINIIHMDLKPANILLNDDLVPKISDFGISRSGDTSETVSQSWMYSAGYCAREYIEKGQRTTKSDIYSLGVIINEVVTGRKEGHDAATVHRRWRHRWQNVIHTTLAYHQQVNKCLELARRCNYDDPNERPSIDNIIRELNEIENTSTHISDASKSSVEQQKRSFLEHMLGIKPLDMQLSPMLNRQIAHVIQFTNDTDDYVAFRITHEEREMAFVLPDARRISFCIHPSKDIVPPRSSCIVNIVSEALNKPLPEYCVQKLRVPIESVKVDGGLTIKDIATDMFKEETGKVVDVVDLMVTLRAQKQLLLVKPQELRCWPIEPNKPLPCSLQLTNRTDNYVAYMLKMPHSKLLYYQKMGTGIIPPCSTSRVIMDMVVKEEALIETQCKDRCLMQSLAVDKDLRVGDVSIEFINGQMGVHEMELDIVFSEKPSPVHHHQMLYGEQDSEEDEPDLREDVAVLKSPLTMETGLLHIYPSELHFASKEEKKYISLINKTDKEVICATENINGVVLPQSTLPILVSYNEIFQFGVTMISGSRRYRTTEDIGRLMYNDHNNHGTNKDGSRFHIALTHDPKDIRQDLMNQVRAEGGKAQQALLPRVISAPRLENKGSGSSTVDSSSNRRGGRRIKQRRCRSAPPPCAYAVDCRGSLSENKQRETLRMDENGLGYILCMDVHPKEPLIVTCHDGHESCGTVCIWNVDPKTSASRTTMSTSISTASLMQSVKFIARMQWIACGDQDRNIIVYTYTDNTLTEIKKFEAQSDYSLQCVYALAVHPTLPYLLSAVYSNLIQLWDWDKGWTCTKKFSCTTSCGGVQCWCPMSEIAFNPKDANTFASYARIGEINIWSIDSEEPLSTIWAETVDDTVRFAYCNAGLVRSSHKKAGIEIFDLLPNTARHVHTLQAQDLLQENSRIATHPTRPLLAATGSGKHVYLWNYTTCGLKDVNAYDDDDDDDDASKAVGIGFIDVNTCFQRLVIAGKNKIKIVDIDI